MKLAMFDSKEQERRIDSTLSGTLDQKIYRTAVYIRVSTDNEEQKSSIKNQKELAQQVAKEEVG